MSGNLVPFPNPKKTKVVDAWPVMEWLKNREPAASAFDAIIEEATTRKLVLFMSTMNLGEVSYSSAKEWGLDLAEEYLLRVRQLPINFVAVSDEYVFLAARFKAVHAVSYADSFAASLAIRLACPLITGDFEFLAHERSGILQLHWAGE